MPKIQAWSVTKRTVEQQRRRRFVTAIAQVSSEVRALPRQSVGRQRIGSLGMADTDCAIRTPRPLQKSCRVHFHPAEFRPDQKGRWGRSFRDVPRHVAAVGVRPPDTGLIIGSERSRQAQWFNLNRNEWFKLNRGV